MKKTELKPPLSFQDQLDHLINDKKLIVKHYDNALELLKRDNYYRLSGYWIKNLDEKDEFLQTVTFESIYNIYTFDKVLRGLLLQIINDVEVYFKTRMANFFTLRYGADGYLDNTYFIDNDKHKKWITNIENLKISNPNNLIVRHHERKYDGIMPFWVSVELMSLGAISKMYSNMTNTDKKDFSRFGYSKLTYTYLESFYHVITYFRNQNCHFQRLYDVSHNIKSKIYNTNFYKPTNNKTTFYNIYILMLLNPNEEFGKQFVLKLEQEFSRYDINISKYGFPSNWKDILDKANGYCIEI